MCCKSTVPFGHEWPSIVLMLEFGHEHPVFTIQGDGEKMLRGILSRIEELLTDVIEVSNEIGNSCFWRHRSILERNSVRDDSITENDSNITTICTRDFPWCGKIGHILNIDVITILIRGLFENFLICYHPLNSNICYRLNHRWRDRFFTRPHARWTEAKFVLKQIHSCNEVILDIFRPCILIDTDAVFHCPTLHHQQWHDWMIVWRCCQFNLTIRCKFTVHRQNIPHVCMLSVKNVIQIIQIVISALHEQIDQTLITMTRVV